MAGGEGFERYFPWSRNFLQHISYGAVSEIWDSHYDPVIIIAVPCDHVTF